MTNLVKELEKWANVRIHGEPGYEAKVSSDGQLQIYPRVVEIMGLGFRSRGPLKFYVELFNICKQFRQGTEPQSEQPRGNREGEASGLSESKEPHLNNQ